MDLEELMTYGCSSLAWVTKWLFLENQQSLAPWLGLSSGRRYTRQSAIPQGVDDLVIQDGMTLLHTFINFSPTCCEICIQILDQTTISTDSYHPGSIKAQERLRRSSPEIIKLDQLSGSHRPIIPRASMQRMTQKTVMLYYGVVSRPGFQAGQDKYGSPHCEG